MLLKHFTSNAFNIIELEIQCIDNLNTDEN
jgi:hypothetical protein